MAFAIILKKGIAFYAIVHFDYEQIKIAFREIYRVLAENGQFLFSFHIGESVINVNEFLDHTVDVDFHFFESDKITALLMDLGFKIIDVIERYPYKDIEYPSKRAYIWVKK